MKNRVHQWLVVRGRIAVTTDDTHVLLEADPEGTAYCVMNAQDAREVAGILTEHAKTLWDASSKAPEPKASVEGGPRSFRLQSESGTLALVAHDTESLIALSYEGVAPCKLTVTQGVALVQVIQYMLQELDGVGT